MKIRRRHERPFGGAFNSPRSLRALIKASGDARDGGERGSTRCQMQELSARPDRSCRCLARRSLYGAAADAIDCCVRSAP
jgi:hypothetical protein